MKSKRKTGLGTEVPPAFVNVQIFFDQAGFSEAEAEHFFHHYDEMEWRGLRGGLIRNWKTKAQEWIWEIKLHNPHLRIK
jgi:hypothetical protein